MSSPPRVASFLSQVRNLMDTLPPTERRVAAFILDFPGDLASYNASELASLIEVSNATVTRFVRRLGYQSYEEARRHARDERAGGSPLYFTPAPPGVANGSIGAHIRLAQSNVAATFAALGESTLDEIAAAIAGARGAWFLGYRNNRSFAGYLRWQLSQVLERTCVIPGPGETLGEHAVDLGAQDVLVVFALRRSVPLATAFAQRAAAAGAQVLYVTDQLSPALSGVKWFIRCHCAAPGPLDSHVAVMLLCDLLATRAMAHAGTRGRRRLAAVEAAHDALAEMDGAGFSPPG